MKVNEGVAKGAGGNELGIAVRVWEVARPRQKIPTLEVNSREQMIRYLVGFRRHQTSLDNEVC